MPKPGFTAILWIEHFQQYQPGLILENKGMRAV